VIVRPMSFTNGAKTGNVSVVTDMSLTVKLRLRIARADVAAFLVEQVINNDHVGQMPVIYSRICVRASEMTLGSINLGR
jgi:hypothetical protein